jgi:hypothetical protein
MDKKEIKEKIEWLKENAVAADSFKEAFDARKPWLYRRHKTVIVASEQINEAFGGSPFRMASEVVEVLLEMGGKRRVQGVYADGKRVALASVWSLPL